MTERDTEDLIELWNVAFGDDPRYIKNFLKLQSKPENTVVLAIDGQVVSAAYLLEHSMNVAGRNYSAYYFYAAATLPEYRNKGYMGKVVERCLEVARERSIDFMYLVPAEGSLYRYYTQFGFRTCFYARTVNYTFDEFRAAVKDNSIADLKSGPVDPLLFNVTDIAEVREDAYRDLNHIVLDKAAVRYALFEHATTGGQLLCDGSSYVLYTQEGDTIDVKEICPPVLDGAMARALLALHAKKYIIHAPNDCEIDGQRKTSGRAGMAIALNKHARTASGKMQNAYIGITLG